MALPDALRTGFAVVVGYLVAVVGVELLPELATHRLEIPVTLGIAAGVLATIGIRKGLRTTHYGTLGGAILFLSVGVAMLAQGEAGPMAVEYAWTIVFLGLVGIAAHEIFVQTSALVAADSVENAGQHRMVKIPAAIVGFVAVAARTADLEGTDSRLAWSGAVVLTGLHVAVVTVHASTFETVGFVLAATALFVLFPVCGPGRVTAESRAGSITAPILTAPFRAGRAVFDVLERAVAGTVRTTNRLWTVVTNTSVPTVAASAATAEGAGGHTIGRVADSRTDDQTASDSASESIEDSQERDSIEPDETDDTSTAEDRSDDLSDNCCQNCGQWETTVRSRSIVPVDGAGGTVALCARCHAARRCGKRRPDTDVPISRSRVLSASDGQCRGCGVDSGGRLELYPVVPLDGRGHRHEYNVVGLCPTCHGAVHEH